LDKPLYEIKHHLQLTSINCLMSKALLTALCKFLGYFFYLLVPLLSIPDEGYSEKTLCIPNLISTFLFNHIFFKSKLTPNWTIWKYQVKLLIHFMRIIGFIHMKNKPSYPQWIEAIFPRKHFIVHRFEQELSRFNLKGVTWQFAVTPYFLSESAIKAQGHRKIR